MSHRVASGSAAPYKNYSGEDGVKLPAASTKGFNPHRRKLMVNMMNDKERETQT